MRDHIYKRSMLLLILLLSGICMYGKPVSRTEALNFAERFFSTNHYMTKSVDHHYVCIWDSNVLQKVKTRSFEAPLFYVITPEEGEGFVIVAAEDKIDPVLAYSFDSRISRAELLPPNLKEWLELVCQYITAIRNTDIKDAPKIMKEWKSPSRFNSNMELETALWGQDFPYNLQCPLDGSGENCVTGCTATATAILMKYNAWPDKGNGFTPSYTCNSNIFVKSRDLNHTYDWSKMPTNGENFTSEGEQEVACLMADIGAAYRSIYSRYVTAAYLQSEIFEKNFSYKITSGWLSKDQYSEREWIEILKKELSTDKPILYRGDNGGMGHMFIIDGYDNSNKFHVNWGWDGYCNGYFRISDLVVQGYNFNYNQMGLIGLKSKKKIEIKDWIIMKAPGLETDLTQFMRAKPFTISQVHFANDKNQYFEGFVRLAVTDRKGKIKEWLHDEIKCELDPQEVINLKDIPALIKEKIKYGDRIRMFYRHEFDDNWYLIQSEDSSCTWEIPLTDEFPLKTSTSIHFDKKTGMVTISYQKDVRCTVLYDEKEIECQYDSELNATLIKTADYGEKTYKVKLEKGKDQVEFTFNLYSIKKTNHVKEI